MGLVFRSHLSSNSTNSVLSMDLTACVLGKEAVPNGRSSVILGLKGCIDALQHRSIPRSILEA
ncbi:uncharacterized protein BP01DRAFT_352232 [Aspergillus saccharolyticus JOP 1030-1]|uniref:Uncharacterized protein n=1 Tax=Aspergillus saccharolyticus JOP 1030-1 TaxID=1450539 RepID=A0A318ZZM4_9EURO|nr:hypothetical protein BP01DRAFT_352232 [Aspergillus saccharolyticus JOP 1030-1]PYH49670.1 hypothetical protein BP01DRAFT_352232 [Aspergillus saccharolyticus JOP 1030-1]